MEAAVALSEAEALELLAFLITAARGLLDEPVDYGPLRLLQAAERICTVAGPKVSPRVKELMNRLVVEIPRHAARRNGDPEGYVRFLDDSCRSLASTLMTYHDVERRES